MLFELVIEPTLLSVCIGCRSELFVFLLTQNGIAIVHLLFVKLYVLTLYNINKYQTWCFMYKIHDNLLPLNFVSLFSKNYCIHNYNTRQEDSFHVISHRTKVRELSVKIRGINLWKAYQQR